ncbi:pectinesterase 2-like [Syzygium oleosum]|uniref:pectinesterase 2-like n=1 Tax=Syzygium oleosum TaxID=219896 RepID=UPI0024BAE5B2|nr:pectinesterase 2-like [Syzygium oleosum]
MGVHQKFMIIVFLPLLLSQTIHSYSSGDVKSWCSQMPYPQPCEYFLTHSPNQTPLKRKSNFIKASMQVALERAQLAQADMYSLGPRCRNKREKAAWADCLQLYEHTVLDLNRTIDCQCTQDDVQMWLSSALTNLETCRAGFIKLGVSDNVLPLMPNNVSKLINNALSANYVPYAPPKYTNEFPTWLKPSNRKLLQSPSVSSIANIVVAQDGTGNYKTISEAVTAASKQSCTTRYVIYIKASTYEENVEVGRKLENIMFVGDGIGKTIITGSKSHDEGSTTFKSATIAVVGDGFIAKHITFCNTAGAANHQAVALRSNSDLSIFYQCGLEGYEHTLDVHSKRQFYRECDIYGTVDFIFGNATVIFQNCNIYDKSPPDKVNTITTQDRTHPNQNTGISFQNCKVTAAPDLISIQSSVKTYLGRPRRKYSRTVFMNTYLDCLIDPAGWLEWKGDFALKTLYYGEYKNTGPGSSTTNRVTWAGYHVITSLTEASMFTIGQLIPDGTWLLAAGVPHDAPNTPYNAPNTPYVAPYTSEGYKLFIGFIGDYNGYSPVQSSFFFLFLLYFGNLF